MTGHDEVLVPWKAGQSFEAAVAPFVKRPLNVLFLIPPAYLSYLIVLTSLPVWVKAVDGGLIVLWGGFCVWWARRVSERPEFRAKAAVAKLLLGSPEYAGVHACLQGAFDELQWVKERKATTPGPDGKPVTMVERTYPTCFLVVELDRVRQVMEWVPDPRFPQLARPSLGDEVRVRFDTSTPAVDSEKLRSKVEVLRSKVGLNGFVSEVDLSRGETRHVDVVFSKSARSGSIF